MLGVQCIIVCDFENTLPSAVGEYCIEVIYDCMAVPCSPFTSKAYDASAIRCCPVPLGFVDKPVEFNGTCFVCIYFTVFFMLFAIFL